LRRRDRRGEEQRSQPGAEPGVAVIQA